MCEGMVKKRKVGREESARERERKVVVE